MNTYKKPVVTVDAGMAEGVYAASGAAQGTLNVTYYGVWDRWGTNGGKGLAMANWSDLNGTITLNITFNDTVDQAETDDASVQASWSGKTATFTFASTASNPLTIGIHIDHGTSIDDLKMRIAQAQNPQVLCLFLKFFHHLFNFHFVQYLTPLIAYRINSRTDI